MADLKWVGEEALMESTHAFVLPPSISNFFLSVLLRETRDTYGKREGLVTTTAMAMFRPDSTTFFLVISERSSRRKRRKRKVGLGLLGLWKFNKRRRPERRKMMWG